MITVTTYRNQKIAVFGLGKSGEASIAALLAGGAEVFAWDDKLGASTEGRVPSEQNTHSSSLATRHFSQWPWSELKALVLAPGVALSHPAPHPVVSLAKQHGVPVIGDIDLLYGACPKARYIGITGTNGKSTTTALIGHILKEAGCKVQVGGNIGTAALALEPLGEDGMYVLEMSSYQLDLMQKTRFNVAVFLNITPDHLDRHGDMQGYVRAKMRIFAQQQPGDVAVVAVDDEYTSGIRDSGFGIRGVQLVSVSAKEILAEGVYVQEGILHDVLPKKEFPESRILNPESLIPISALTGQHNWQNAAAAYAAARAIGATPQAIMAGMKSFPGLRHRLQLVASIDGVRFFNDSKATNADATRHALAPFDAIYWIAGGKPKEGGIEPLAPFFPKIAHAFLIGQAEEEFADTLRGRVAFTRCGTLQVALEKAASSAFAEGRAGAVVLLSPACASFDQWKSFEERGDAFCKMVEALAEVRRGAKHAS